MAPEVGLERLQRWMQAVIVHPGHIAEALYSEGAQHEVPAEAVGDVILPSKTLAPAERVAIYHGMYLLRMEEALASDYPALKHFLGDEGFFDLVRDYVQVHPSRNFSLNPLGRHLPEFVKSATGLKRPDFCHELARLEWAVAQAFDGPETPRLSEAQIAAVPPEAWETARLEPVGTFRLESFRYPVNDYLQTVVEDNHDHPKARLKDSWIAIYRRDFTVYRLDLTRAAHDLLADLARGTPLGDAIGKAIKAGGRRAPSEHELFRWFRQWVSVGVFQSVQTE
ncbi:MAG TPA: DNA-binding domain-containing protein [Vicinamibacteria bacterium]